MLKKSNLYIEKIYRDHPVACWPLDDDISFVQLFSAGEQDIGEWNTTNVSSIEYPVNDEVDVIFTIASASANFTASIESPWSLNSLSDFDSNKTSAFFSL